MLNLIRRLRNRFTGLSVIQSRLDTLQNQLDALSTHTQESGMRTEQACESRLDTLQNQLDALSTHTQESGMRTDQVHEDKLTAKDNPASLACVRTAINIDDARSSIMGFLSLQPNEAVRIAFIVQHPSIWPSWRSIWIAANTDQRFSPKIILSPFMHSLSSEALTYDDMKTCLLEEKVPFHTAEFFDLNEFKPHVVFVQNSYEETRPEYLRIHRLKEVGARIAYVPYGLEMGGGAWNITAQFDSLVHRSAWRIFARSERHKKMFGKYCAAGNGHVVITGHPKFESCKTDFNPGAIIELTNKIAGRKVVLWTPHFSVGAPPTWSTFQIYSKFILAEMERRQDLFLLIRPHPLFFKSMQQHQLWNVGGEQGFRQLIRGSANMALDETSDYELAFSLSNALMTDVGSFLLEYLPTGKPLLYLHHSAGLGMNDDEDLVHYLYTASESDDIADFIDMVSRGDDPRKTERESIISEFLCGISSKIGENICEHIFSSLSVGDSGSPLPHRQDSAHQEHSDTYWRGSSYTYLAPPDYYDTKATILRDILARLPIFENVVDIGCGDGRFTFLLAERSRNVTAYDIAPALLEKARDTAIVANVRNAQFFSHEIEAIAPFEKYDLVACMGVTSCIIQDTKFLSVLEKFRMLSKHGALLLLIDTLSSEHEQTVKDQSSGYIAKYRALNDYRTLITRRGYELREEILVREDVEKKLVNKLFLFEFNDNRSVTAHIFRGRDKIIDSSTGTNQ